MHRGLDGKKFKLFSLKTLDESSLRLPQYVQALRKNKTLHFKFPSPLGLGLSSPSAVLLSLDRCSISWGNGNASAGMVGDVAPILKSVSLSITMSSRIAIVGPNGQGMTIHLLCMRLTVNGFLIYGQSRQEHTAECAPLGVQLCAQCKEIVGGYCFRKERRGFYDSVAANC